jgi:hypothetical protein
LRGGVGLCYQPWHARRVSRALRLRQRRLRGGM